MSDYTDRRRWPRIPLQQDVLVKVATNEAGDIPGRSQDLSAGGMFLHLDTEIGIGKDVKVSFALPAGDARIGSISLVMPAVVVRVEEHVEGRFGVAVAFEHGE
jgi:c-di-GMP-binding flagellar brake protein YcgR